MSDAERERLEFCEFCGEEKSHLLSATGKRGLCMGCGNEVVFR